MVELHDNKRLKHILNNEDFEPHKDTAYSKTLLYASVYCNNYDAYLMLINHKKIKINYWYSCELFDIIFRKYKNNNTFYFDELMKTNNIINYTIIRSCDNINIDILEKMINRIDFNILQLNKTLEYILSMNNKNDIKSYVLKFMLDNNPLTINYSEIIVKNIIIYGNVELLKLVKNYNINIKIQYAYPCVFHILQSKNQKEFLDYYVTEKYYYNSNMLDMKNIIDYANYCPLCFGYLVDSSDVFSKMFSSCVDTNNKILNETIRQLFSTYNTSWSYHHNIKYSAELYKIILPILKKIFNFLIKKRTNDNLRYYVIFEKIFKTHKHNYTNDMKEYAKIFLNCLVENNFIPDENFQKLINEVL
jgi:hypothetical protein